MASKSTYKVFWFPISRWRNHVHEHFDDGKLYTHPVRRWVGVKWGRDHRGRFCLVFFYDGAVCSRGCAVTVGYRRISERGQEAIGTRKWWAVVGHS